MVVDSPVNSEAVECYIGTDNYEAGCMAGEEVLGNPAENLNIGIVNFDKSTENRRLREKGFGIRFLMMTGQILRRPSM